jgi:3-isopropylmalate/(R)-2-methylmalate dehydratase small subunit
VTPLRRVEGLAAALPAANIDTDQLIPARFMKEPRQPEGYGRFLLHDLRAAGADPLAGAPVILVAGPNFGCGSSREAAVYALVDFGVRCVIAPGFGDIFAANAANNGLLAASVDETDAAALLAVLAEGPQPFAVDLETRRIAAPGLDLGFAVDDATRAKLLNGWDDIDLTESHGPAIAAFAEADAARRPWACPPALRDSQP